MPLSNVNVTVSGARGAAGVAVGQGALIDLSNVNPVVGRAALGLGNGAVAGAGELNVATTDNGQSVNDLMTAVGFGGNWFANQRFSRSFATPHFDSRFGFVSSSIETGSTANGPNNSGMASGLLAIKLAFQTSAIQGEIDGQYIIVRQGLLGDASGILVDASKTISGASLTGGILGIETGVSATDASLNRVFGSHSYLGFLVSGNTAGGFGVGAEARVGAGMEAAFIADTLDDRTPGEIAAGSGPGSWAAILKSRAARSDANLTLLIGSDGSYLMGPTGNRKTLKMLGNNLTVLASNGTSAILSLSDDGVLSELGGLVSGGPVVFQSYLVGTVPSAAAHAGGQIDVTNESGGFTPAFSDGTNWRRYSDRAIIS